MKRVWQPVGATSGVKVQRATRQDAWLVTQCKICRAETLGRNFYTLCVLTGKCDSTLIGIRVVKESEHHLRADPQLVHQQGITAPGPSRGLHAEHRQFSRRQRYIQSPAKVGTGFTQCFGGFQHPSAMTSTRIAHPCAGTASRSWRRRWQAGWRGTSNSTPSR